MVSEPLPELLDAKRLQAELGVTRAAAEAECARRKDELGATGRYWNGGPNELVVVELQLDPEG